MFKPLTGGEADERLKEKYGGLEIKSEKLSATLFSNKKSPLIASQKERNSQGKERKKGMLITTTVKFLSFQTVRSGQTV